MNGLLIGLVLGAGLVFLLTTKRGKKILHALTDEGLESISSMDDLYKRLEKAVKVATEDTSPVRQEVRTPVRETGQVLSVPVRSDAVPSYEPQEKVVPTDYVRKAPVLLATDEVTSSKLAEVQERLDREIEDVSQSMVKNYVAYADDDEDIEEPVAKVKVTRRRFFRGIPRRA